MRIEKLEPVPGRGLHAARVELAGRLRGRRDEIADAAIGRAFAIADPGEEADSEYLERLRSSIKIAIGYGIESVETGGSPPDVPAALISQARLAAKIDVSLGTVVRRYVAGFTLFGEFVLQESGSQAGNAAVALRPALHSLTESFDFLVGAVSAEYACERELQVRRTRDRSTDRINRLLAGEPVDLLDVGYDLADSHIGLVVSGPPAEEGIRVLARTFDCRPLVSRRPGGLLWGWLGSRQAVDPAEISRALKPSLQSGLRIAVGEPANGREGWRLSHRQARAAWPIALNKEPGCARYGDVALPAAIHEDSLLASSLRQLYLHPLETSANGEDLKETLRAYFAATQNTSSAAAALEVSRQTVVNRLRTIEQRLGRTLADCSVELAAALRFESLFGR